MAATVPTIILNSFSMVNNPFFKKTEDIDKFWFKVYNVNEGRDFDNKHIFPYVHVQKRDIK